MTKKEIELIEKDIENNLKAGECGLASNNEKFQWTNTANAMKKMLEENKKLKDNWNKLKKFLEEWKENEEYCYLASSPIDRCRKDIYGEVLDKMQELERSDNQ